MDENKNVAAESEVEAETTQDNSPQSEEETTNTQTEDQAQETQDDLPQSEEDQRKAFQEMRQELKALREQQKERESSESAFEAVRPQYEPTNVDPNQYYDANTGEVDWQRFNADNQQKIRAEARQQAREEIDEFQARQQFPELFKDPEVEKQMAAMWTYEKLKGNNASISDIAKQFSKNFSKATSKAEKQGAEKILKEVETKEQAGLSAGAQSGGQARQQTIKAEEYSRLQQASRGGDYNAIAERMSKIPWANK